MSTRGSKGKRKKSNLARRSSGLGFIYIDPTLLVGFTGYECGCSVHLPDTSLVCTGCGSCEECCSCLARVFGA